jgi:predicted Zn-dependent protease
MDLNPARTVAGLLPESARDALGDQVIASMTKDRRVCSDAPGRAALDKLAARLSAGAGDGSKFEIIVSDWSLLNAFAAPGEKIVLTRGLLTKAESPDEVAGVLAHEMGHGVERHPETGIVRAIGLSAAIDLMLGGGGGTLANIGVALAQLSYTRQAEHQADVQALRILQGAKISPRGLADFFRRVQALEGTSGAKTKGAFDILRTHPQTEERLRYVQSSPDYPATPSLSDKEWQALRNICGAAPVDPPKAAN